jgi:hypothetical protein
MITSKRLLGKGSNTQLTTTTSGEIYLIGIHSCINEFSIQNNRSSKHPAPFKEFILYHN